MFTSSSSSRMTLEISSNVFQVCNLIPNCKTSTYKTSNIFLRTKEQRNSRVYAVKGATKKSTELTSGVVFEPFQEVENYLVKVSPSSTHSFARQRFSDSCETSLNEQINVEYNNSYIYHAMFAYFDRDNVGLPGFARFFHESSVEERNHAEMLMKYQNIRGGRVKLQSILMPATMEFENQDKGDALYAMELALSLEKLTNEKLINLKEVAKVAGDAQMQEYIETYFLAQQVKAIKILSEYVSRLRRMGKGHGVWHFDQMLLQGIAAPHTQANAMF